VIGRVRVAASIPDGDCTAGLAVLRRACRKRESVTAGDEPPERPARTSSSKALRLAVATLPFLGMIAVVQTFVYPQAWTEHLLWGSILVFLLTRGAGTLSLDHLVARRFRGRRL
jgi:hypothetical protein